MMALASLLALMIVLILIGVGLVFGMVLAGGLAVLVTAGMVSSSVIIGFSTKSSGSFVKAFIWQLSLLIFTLTGIALALIYGSFWETEFTNLILGTIGGVSGLVAGSINALIILNAFSLFCKWLVNRVKNRGVVR